MSFLNADQLRQFVATDPSGPVVMLNLMQFAPGGEAKYLTYMERFNTSGVKERYGVEVIYGGAGSPSLVAADGREWDMVALVRYPSRQHFVDMVNDSDYQSFEHLRAESVATADLQPTMPII